MTLRLRKESFDKLMHMDISYFDWPEHSVGALTSRLAQDAQLVQGAIGTHLAIIMQESVFYLIYKVICTSFS